MSNQTGPQTYHARHAQLTLPSLCGVDHYLDCPVVLMFGGNDQLTPPKRMAMKWADITSKGLIIKVLEGAPHLFPVYEPCLPEVQAFLKDALLDNVR